MLIERVTMTGADDRTDPLALLDLSRRYPFVEWGILFSERLSGTARYPGPDWLRALLRLAPYREGARFAAHLCGGTMRSFMRSFGGVSEPDLNAWLAPFTLTMSEYDSFFGRTQVNFDQERERFDETRLATMIRRWKVQTRGDLITQHNQANADLWPAIQSADRSDGRGRRHQVLMDASGGRGVSPETWPRPIAGVFCGYAGGLGPDGIIADLDRIADVVGDGVIWIDMEGRLRDASDRFDLARVEKVLSAVADRVL
jgi:hypothetical protein